MSSCYMIAMRERMSRVLTALVLCYLTIFSTAGKASSCIPGERDALVAFKAGVTDPGDGLRSWQGQDCCKWSGVVCSNKTLHVIKLDVSQYALEGKINSSLAALTRLVCLNLSNNNFGGMSIPEFIGSFKKLKYLDLSRANFGGKVPHQLCNLSALEHLDLNSFRSSMIRMDSFLWVSCLGFLRYLNLGWLDLSASSDWLQVTSKLPSLEVLRLNDAYLPATNLNYVSHVNFTALTFRDNHLTGEIPQAIHRLCNLNYMDLSMNHLSGDAAVGNNMFRCLKQLRFLDVSNNNLSGSIAGWLEDLSISVSYLDLSNNLFSKQVPDSIGKLSNLTYLDLSSNTFEGVLNQIHFNNLSRLDFLSLGSNNLNIVIPPEWMPPFQLRALALHACRVGPHFPTWLQSQSKIEMIDLGSSKIMGTLPDWFWNFSSFVKVLDLSNNKITGRLPTSLDQMKMLKMFNMRSNHLVGRIPNLPASVQVLDLSSNRLSGQLPQDLEAKELYSMVLSDNFLSGRIPTYICRMSLMEVIVLSNNYFSGILPDCWQEASRLQTIDFSSNKLHGDIPSTMGSIAPLAILSLRYNNLSGNLTTSLHSCYALLILDLAYNQLSGDLSIWMGGSQESLIILNLRSNQFSGEMPNKLSHLHALQLLDLSSNTLSGPLPLSLGNLTAMYLHNDLQAYVGTYPQVRFTTIYDGPLPQVAVFIVGDIPFHYGLFLNKFLLSSVDLSNNHFTGEIPKEIGALSLLMNLNLSRNYIDGSIPAEIGNLGSLESLDLSRNALSGLIPSSMTKLTNLALLNLSYNDLKGVIPFATFTEDSYLCNAKLCGPQLNRSCLPQVIKHQDKIDRGTYLFAMLGFASGFYVVSAILLFSATARTTYFQFTDSILDEVQTAVAIKLNRVKVTRGHSMENRRVCSQNSITCYELEFGTLA